LSLVFGWHPDGEQQTQAWTGWILGQPFGPGLVGVVGFLILTCGIGVIVWVMTTDIDDDVDLPDSEKRAIVPLGRYGLVGRGAAGQDPRCSRLQRHFRVQFAQEAAETDEGAAPAHNSSSGSPRPAVQASSGAFGAVEFEMEESPQEQERR